VGANQPEAAVRGWLRADAKGDDAAAVADDVGLVAGAHAPRVTLIQRRESGGIEPARHLGDRVKRRGRVVDERAEVFGLSRH
jgi:hypothetical protein